MTQSYHKFPFEYRYFNISVLWILYYPKIIMLAHKFKIRHELLTFSSFISGIIASLIIINTEQPIWLFVSAIFVHCKDLFDACDGALARLTKTGHLIGRLMDSVLDFFTISTIVIACGVYAKHTMPNLPSNTICTAVVLTTLSIFLQCSYFNYYQIRYSQDINNELLASTLDESQHLGKKYYKNVIANIFLWSLIVMYLVIYGWQDKLMGRIDHYLLRINGYYNKGHGAWYRNKSFLTAASMLCFGTHLMLISLALVFNQITWIFWGITVWLNIYWLIIMLIRAVYFRD